jgi:hypothetical protein
MAVGAPMMAARRTGLPDLARTTAEPVAAQILKSAPDTPGLTMPPPWPHVPAA